MAFIPRSLGRRFRVPLGRERRCIGIMNAGASDDSQGRVSYAMVVRSADQLSVLFSALRPISLSTLYIFVSIYKIVYFEMHKSWNDINDH